MSIQSIDHFNVRVPTDELLAARDFYVAVLGFSEGPRPAFSSKGFWLYVGGQPLLHLSGFDPAVESRTGLSALDHVALCATDRASIAARLTTRGIAFQVEEIAETGVTQLFFRDPYGARIELDFNESEEVTHAAHPN